MSAKTFAWLILLQITLIVCHTIMQGLNDKMPDLILVLQMKALTFNSYMGIPILWPNMDWFKGLFNLVSWNYAMFSADWGIWIRFFLCPVVQALLIWGTFVYIVPPLTGILQAVGTFMLSAVSILNPLRWFT